MSIPKFWAQNLVTKQPLFPLLGRIREQLIKNRLHKQYVDYCFIEETWKSKRLLVNAGAGRGMSFADEEMQCGIGFRRSRDAIKNPQKSIELTPVEKACYWMRPSRY